MRKSKYFWLLMMMVLSMVSLNEVWGQEYTYSSNPAIGTWISGCPTSNTSIPTDCPKTNANILSTIKMRVVSINASQIVFEIDKCDINQTISSSGYAHVTWLTDLYCGFSTSSPGVTSFQAGTNSVFVTVSTSWFFGGNEAYWQGVIKSSTAGTYYLTNSITITRTPVATPVSYNISTSANNSSWGSVFGGGTYQQNNTASVSASAYNGYQFNYWTENGNIVSYSSYYSFTVSANRNLVANFSAIPKPQVYIGVSANNASYGSVSGSGYYEQGSSYTIVGTPISGYKVSNITENGSIITTNSSYTLTAGTQDRNFVVNFVQDCVKPNPPSSFSATDGTLKDRVRLTWVKVPDVHSYRIYVDRGDGKGQVLLRQTVDGSYDDFDASTQPQTYFIESVNACNVSATQVSDVGYKATLYTLNINKSSTSTGNGGVKINGISYTLPYSYTYIKNESLTIEGEPYSSSILGGMTDGTQSLNSPSTITMSGNKNLTITYIDNSAILSITGNGTGSGIVKINGATRTLPCTIKFTPNANVTVEAVAASGSTLAGFSDGIQSLTNPVTLIMSSNRSLTVTFNTVTTTPANVTCQQDITTTPTGDWTKGESASATVTLVNNGGSSETAIYALSWHDSNKTYITDFEKKTATIAVGGTLTLSRTSSVVTSNAGTYHIMVKKSLDNGNTWTTLCEKSVVVKEIQLPPSSSDIILSPLAGTGTQSAYKGLQPTSTVNSVCSHWQHGYKYADGKGHTVGGGMGGADDTYCFDSNINYPYHNTDKGALVYPVADGVIVYNSSFSSWKGSSYGQLLLKHTRADGSVYYSGYLHMNNIISKVDGQFVSVNTPIGRVGKEMADNEHLHWGIYELVNGVLVSKQVTITNREIGGASGNPKMSILLSHETASQGDTAKVFLTVNNLLQARKLIGQGTITFNDSSLVFEKAIFTKNNASIIAYLYDNQNIIFSMMNNTTLYQDKDTLAVLYFKVKETAPLGKKEITLNSSLIDRMFAYDENNSLITIPTDYFNGSVTIEEARKKFTVKVINGKGSVVENTNVKVYNPNETFSSSTDKDGNAVFNVLKNKEYKISLSKANTGKMTDGINVIDATLAQYESVLKPNPITIQGIIAAATAVYDDSLNVKDPYKIQAVSILKDTLAGSWYVFYPKDFKTKSPKPRRPFDYPHSDIPMTIDKDSTLTMSCLKRGDADLSISSTMRLEALGVFKIVEAENGTQKIYAAMDFDGLEGVEFDFSTLLDAGIFDIRTEVGHSKVLSIDTEKLRTIKTGDYLCSVRGFSGGLLVAEGMMPYSISQDVEKEASVMLFPNPTKDNFTILSNEKINKILIYNLLGNLMVETEVANHQYVFNENKLTKGLYLVKVFTDNGEKQMKLVID